MHGCTTRSIGTTWELVKTANFHQFHTLRNSRNESNHLTGNTKLENPEHRSSHNKATKVCHRTQWMWQSTTTLKDLLDSCSILLDPLSLRNQQPCSKEAQAARSRGSDHVEQLPSQSTSTNGHVVEPSRKELPQCDQHSLCPLVGLYQQSHQGAILEAASPVWAGQPWLRPHEGMCVSSLQLISSQRTTHRNLAPNHCFLFSSASKFHFCRIRIRYLSDFWESMTEHIHSFTKHICPSAYIWNWFQDRYQKTCRSLLYKMAPNWHNLCIFYMYFKSSQFTIPNTIHILWSRNRPMLFRE